MSDNENVYFFCFLDKSDVKTPTSINTSSGHSPASVTSATTSLTSSSLPSNILLSTPTSANGLSVPHHALNLTTPEASPASAMASPGSLSSSSQSVFPSPSPPKVMPIHIEPERLGRSHHGTDGLSQVSIGAN